MSLLLLSLLPALGCGKGYQFAPVSGRVLMDGKPLADAEVSFYPTAGKDPPYSAGKTDDQGNYTLSLFGKGETGGAVVGESRVSISLNERNMKKRIGPRGPRDRGPRELVPQQYNQNSTLTCTVPPEGKQDANFDLKSK